MATCAFAGTSTGGGEWAPTVEEPTSEELLPDRNASERSPASPAAYVAARHFPADLAAAGVGQPPAHQRAQDFSARAAPDAVDMHAISQHVPSPLLATSFDTASHAAGRTRPPASLAPAAQLHQPPPDTGIKHAQRAASGELPPPPDAAATEQFASRMDEDAAGAGAVWLH